MDMSLHARRPSQLFSQQQQQQQQQQHHHHGQQQHHHQSPQPLRDRDADRDSDDDEYGSADDDSQSGAVNANGDAPRKRQKRPLSVSCELCKQRKVKCDRGQPSCGWCTRNGAICEYKERKKPGLRAGYGRELEQRLDRLEEVLQSHSRILEQGFVRNASTSVPSEHTTPHDGTLFRHDGHAALGSRAETALFVQKPLTYVSSTSALDYGSTLGPSPPSIHSAHGGDIYQQNMGMGLGPQQQLQQSASLQHSGTPYATNQPPQSSPTLNIDQTSKDSADTKTDSTLPPYDLLYALVDLYFKHVNTWCPILHRRSTLDSLFGPRALDEADKVLLRAISATTLRFSTDARLTEESRKYYHDVNKEKVLLYGMENSSVKSLQALVILALDLVGSSNGPPGWNLLALITRSVVQLGLAVEMSSISVSPNYPSIYTLRAMVLPDSQTWIEEESRRRLFWMIYLLDRYATLATAFEFALSETEIDRQLPCRDDLWNKNVAVETRWFKATEHTEHVTDHPENLGAFSYYIEILGVLSRIHKFLKKPVDISALEDVEKWQAEYRSLDNYLHEWKFQLPQEYGNMAKLFQPSNNKAINPGWVMLHATYHTAVVRLHSSAAYPTTRSPIFTPSYSASQRCHAAVENIAALGEYVVQSNMLDKLGPPFAFTLWVAARLLLVHGSTVEHKLSPQIPIFVNLLREMGRYWAVAERYTTILQRVLDEHKDSEEAAGPAGERVTPSSVKILADMRRCAYDLDFLISRQPRHIGPGGNRMSRMPSVTPARTPAPNELEYLDVFDFFNLPRLPMEMSAGNTGMPGDNVDTGLREADMTTTDSNNGMGANGGNEFNITNYMVDMNSDWLYKQT